MRYRQLGNGEIGTFKNVRLSVHMRFVMDQI
jgi:hypothetical protein